MMSASVTERLMSAERRASVEKAVNLAPRVPEHFSRDRQIALFIFLSSLGYALRALQHDALVRFHRRVTTEQQQITKRRQKEKQHDLPVARKMTQHSRRQVHC